MAITVTAGSDVEYEFTDLPLSDVPLQALGTPHSGSMATWLWQLVGAPDGHGASIISPTSQNTYLTGADIPGDYVLAASGTDTAGNATSTDYRTMEAGQFKVISVKMENGSDLISEKQKGWWERFKANMLKMDAALGRLGPVPISVASSAISHITTENQFNGINIEAPLTGDWIKVETFIKFVVDTGESAWLRWRVAPSTGDIFAGEILQEVEINTSGDVFVEMALNVGLTGALLDGAYVNSVSRMTTSVGMPGGTLPDIKARVGLDISGNLQLALTLEPITTWGYGSSAETTEILGGRDNKRRI